MPRLMKILLLLSVVLIAVCFVQANEQPLKLELAISEAEPLLLETVLIKATLTNISKKPAVIRLGHINFGCGCTNLHYGIYQDGKALNYGRPTCDCAPSEPQALPPGESWTAYWEFQAGKPFAQSGNYEFKAAFKDEYPLRDGESFWQGNLEAALSFQVQAPQGDDKAAFAFMYEKEINKITTLNPRSSLTKEQLAGSRLLYRYGTYYEELSARFPDSLYTAYAFIRQYTYKTVFAYHHQEQLWDVLEQWPDISNQDRALAAYANQFINRTIRQWDKALHYFDKALQASQNPNYKKQIEKQIENTKAEKYKWLNVKLELSLSQKKALQFEPVEILITLTNTGQKPQSFESALRFRGCSHLWLEGTRNSEPLKNLLGFDKCDQQEQLLQPGESLFLRHLVSSVFDLTRPGSYEIWARYMHASADSVWLEISAPQGQDKDALSYLRAANKKQNWFIHDNEELEWMLADNYTDFSDLATRFPDSVYSRYALALLCQKNCDDCLGHRPALEAMYLNSPDSVLKETAYACLGKAYSKTGDDAKALKYYKLAFEFARSNQRASELTQIIRRLDANSPPPTASPGYGSAIPWDDSSIVAPTLIKNVIPVYPPEAARLGIEGVVSLIITIDEQGNVGEITVHKDGPPGMTEAAIEAVKQWKYSPATFKGQPVSIYKSVRVNFELEE